MPYITTHTFFALDCLESSPNTKNLIGKPTIYGLFAQGFDPFFYHDFFKFSKFKHSAFCHKNNTDKFFCEFIDLIKKEKLTHNKLILQALFGHLTHYVLDSNMHPYIVYKTGIYNKDHPKSKKYQGLHTALEFQLDTYFYEKKYQKPFNKFNLAKELAPKTKLEPNLIAILNRVYLNVFNFKNGGSLYQDGLNWMHFSLKHLIYDPHGLKTKIYQTIDYIFKTKYAVYSSNVILENTEFLNLEHETWYNPWDKTKKNSSVLDIYADAKKECLEIFEATINYLEDKITLKEYQKVLQAKSYVTGLPYTNHYSNLKLSF